MQVERFTIGIGRAGQEQLELIGKRYKGGDPTAPRILITGALHGDELTAVGAVSYLAERLAKDSPRSAVTLLPCVNVLGAKAGTRFVPLEDSDLNRVFPGRDDGSLAERIAAALVRLLTSHDVLIDVHTAGWCVPFVLVDRSPDNELNTRVTRWAKTSGLPVIGEMESGLATLQGLERSWSTFAMGRGKAALTVELSGVRTLDSQGSRLGSDALVKLLTAAPSESSGAATVELIPHRLELYCNTSGLFEAFHKPGDRLSSGDEIGVIRSFEWSVLETIRTDSPGLLLALQPVSSVHVGSFVATIAVGESSGAEA